MLFNIYIMVITNFIDLFNFAFMNLIVIVNLTLFSKFLILIFNWIGIFKLYEEYSSKQLIFK
jgi:hypothetical protein